MHRLQDKGRKRGSCQSHASVYSSRLATRRGTDQ
jgi:hypothetical protein